MEKIDALELKIKKIVISFAISLGLYLVSFMAMLTLMLIIITGGNGMVVPEVKNEKLGELRRIASHCGIEWNEMLAYLLVINDGNIDSLNLEYEAIDFLIVRYKKSKEVMFDELGNVTYDENLAFNFAYELVEDRTLYNREDIINFYYENGGRTTEATKIYDTLRSMWSSYTEDETGTIYTWETYVSSKNGMDFYSRLNEEQREWYNALLTDNLLISIYGEYYELSADIIQEMQGFFTWVVPYTKNLTSYYGYRENPVYGGQQFHKGIDIAAIGCAGKNVLASAKGYVADIQYKSTGYGNCVYINHTDKNGNKWQTRYAHLDQIFVEKNDSVEQGAVIGTIGTTGESTGYHLHFEIFFNGNVIDPLLLLEN